MLAKAKRTEREEGGVGREDQAAMSFTSVTRVLPLKTVLNCSAIAYSFCKRGINGSGYNKPIGRGIFEHYEFNGHIG